MNEVYNESDKDKKVDIAIEAMMALVGQKRKISLEEFSNKLSKNLNISQEGFIDIIKESFYRTTKYLNNLDKRLDTKIASIDRDQKYMLDKVVVDNIQKNYLYYNDSKTNQLVKECFKYLDLFHKSDSVEDYVSDVSVLKEEILQHIESNKVDTHSVKMTSYNGDTVIKLLSDIKDKLTYNPPLVNKIVFENKSILEKYTLAGAKWGYLTGFKISLILFILLFISVGTPVISLPYLIAMLKPGLFTIAGTIGGSSKGVVKTIRSKNYNLPNDALNKILADVKNKQTSDLEKVNKLLFEL